MSIPVEAQFTGAVAGRPMFTLLPVRENDNVYIGVSLTDLIESGEWKAVSFPHVMEDITFDETDMSGLLQYCLRELEGINLKLSVLYGSEKEIDRSRIFRNALTTIFTLTFKHMTGFWPHNLRELGIAV